MEVVKFVKEHKKVSIAAVAVAAAWIGIHSGGETAGGGDRPHTTSASAGSAACETTIDHIPGTKVVVAAKTAQEPPAGTTMHYTFDTRKRPAVEGDAPAGETEVTLEVSALDAVTEATATLNIPGQGEVKCTTASD